MVTGWGSVSHKNLSCPALLNGLARAAADGRGRSGFFAVAVSLADTWVGRCQTCLGDAALEVGEAGRSTQRAAASMKMAPASREEASSTRCEVCGEPLTRGQRRGDLLGTPCHLSCLSEDERARDRNTRLIESGVTFASRRKPTYRRGKGPASYR